MTFHMALYQPALENCKLDGGISDTARTVAVEHCQPDNSSPNGGQQLETDILEVTNDRFQCFESLPHDYYKTSEEFQSEKVVNDPYFPFSSDFMEIDGQIRICQAQDLEQKQMNGNQGRAKLNGFRNLISVGGQEKADNQLVEGANPNIQPSILDDLRNLQSDHTVPDDLEAPEVMSTHVNSRKIDGGICRAKRCKFLEADIQTKPHEAEQRKYSDEEQETRKRLEDTMENHSIVYKRSKVSSQTDDYRVTSVVTSRDAYGSTSEKYVERLDSPTA